MYVHITIPVDGISEARNFLLKLRCFIAGNFGCCFISVISDSFSEKASLEFPVNNTYIMFIT